MEKFKSFVDSLHHSNEEEKEILAFSENLLNLLNVFEPSDNNADIPVKNYHNKLLNDFSRRCLYTFKGHIRRSPFKDYSDSLCYLFKEIVDIRVSILKYQS